MKNLLKITLGLSTLIGCAKVEMESRVRPNFDRKISDLCIVVSCARSIDDPFFEGLKTRLEAAFHDRNIRVAVLLVKPSGPGGQGGFLAFPYGGTIPLGGDQPIAAPQLPSAAEATAQAGFPPAFFMTIHSTQIGRGAGAASARFALGLKATDSQQDVWKASVSMEWGAGSFGSRGGLYSAASPIGISSQEVAARIIQRLGMDNLI